MKVLITGATGFIGWHLMEALPHAETFQLSEDQDVREKFPDNDYTHIFHLASVVSIPDCEKDPRKAMDTNVWGTLNLIRKYPNARIICASSAAANNPTTVYGFTKLFQEELGLMHENFLAVRIYNVFGERQSAKWGAAIPMFLEAKTKGQEAILYGEGKGRRDFVYVKDVVLNMIDLMFNSDQTGVEHLGYGSSVTIREICDRIMGKDGKIKFEDSRGSEVRNCEAPYCMPIVEYGLDKGLQRTIANWGRE